MTELPSCPSCTSAFTYQDGALLVCPECGHEWSLDNPPPPDEQAQPIHKDAVGNVLEDGDTVTVVKDLKVKGASSALKAGTKVRATFDLSTKTTTSTARSMALVR